MMDEEQSVLRAIVCYLDAQHRQLLNIMHGRSQQNACTRHTNGTERCVIGPALAACLASFLLFLAFSLSCGHKCALCDRAPQV